MIKWSESLESWVVGCDTCEEKLVMAGVPNEETARRCQKGCR